MFLRGGDNRTLSPLTECSKLFSYTNKRVKPINIECNRKDLIGQKLGLKSIL